MITSRNWKHALLIVPFLLFCNVQTSQADIVLGQVDSFTSGTADGWSEGPGSPNPPVYDPGLGADGNPGHLFNLSSGTGMAGSRLAMFNFDMRWLGDYLGAGVSAITLDADNRSGNGNDINLRLAFNGAGGWFYTNAVTLADGSGWTGITYDITSLNYASGGTGVFGDTMTGVTQFEIFSQSGPIVVGGGGTGIIRGDLIAAELHVDNISAIPEPASAIVIVYLGALLLSRRRR